MHQFECREVVIYSDTIRGVPIKVACPDEVDHGNLQRSANVYGTRAIELLIDLISTTR